MKGNNKIKNIIIFYTAIMLCAILALNIFFYAVLQKESILIINSIFDVISENNSTQIEELNVDVADLSTKLAVDADIQNMLYYYTDAEIVSNMANTKKVIEDYRARNKNIVFLGVIKDNEIFFSSEDIKIYDEVRNIISNLDIKNKKITSEFLSSFIKDGRTLFPCVTQVFPTNVLYYSDAKCSEFIVAIYEVNTLSNSNYSFFEDSQIALRITDENNKILLSPDLSEHNKIIDDLEIENDTQSKSRYIDISKWNVITYLSVNNISLVSKLSSIYMICMLFVSALIILLMIRLLNEIIVKRIILLRDNVKNILSSDSSFRVRYDYKDELSEIVTVINQSLDKINNLNLEKFNVMERLYNAELLQKETQMIYLSGQVSPHFLYNSLSHIQGLACIYHANEIIKMTTALSSVFRYYSDNVPVSNIGRDLKCAIDYFDVINMRRNEPLTLNNNVDSSLETIKCLKMIFQPILENVLKHAFSPNETGTITISSVYDEKKVIIDITDDGKGMTAEKLHLLNEKLNAGLSETFPENHVGIINVNSRLKLYYNESCGVQIVSNAGEGFTVRIIFEKDFPDNKIIDWSSYNNQ